MPKATVNKDGDPRASEHDVCLAPRKNGEVHAVTETRSVQAAAEREAILMRVLERERKLSTGFGRGVAVRRSIVPR